LHLPPPTMLVNTTNPMQLPLTNPNPYPIRVSSSTIVALMHHPHEILDWADQLLESQVAEFRQKGRLMWAAASKLLLSDSPVAPEDDHEAQGGPKTAEPAPGEEVTLEKLTEVVDVNPKLPRKEQELLRELVRKHEKAFTTMGNLGKYNAKVHITLKPGAEPVSLLPYHASPLKREIIDKQLDAWLEMGVIEQSQSPWGAPVIIVSRKGKNRLCVDWRKLNEVTVPDEFPIPRQTDILQALSGSQYMSTLDALSGFTQLEFDHESKDKTAFRSHRGLFQFTRIPFGWRNGLPVFQRVMQEILSPFLWQFALVYIDDIVVYSATFAQHLGHLDRVLQAIAHAHITLSPLKCHLGYQSLLLLGQKVSRLGLSTDKEKVRALLELEEPQNRKTLRVFLGMAVYFASFIPHYALIARPLFNLLKEGAVWTWNETCQ
jgi:hypothetical protein